MENYRICKLRSIMEAVNWVCDDARDIEFAHHSGSPGSSSKKSGNVVK